jgi:HKD family nuclease
MGWHLQTPGGASPKLLAKILAECGRAQKGGAAFAFASAQGVKLLAAEPVFSKFLKAAEFTIVVGLDGITDTRAVDELRKLSKSHPNFKPKLFFHKTAGSLFHPKTMWLKTPTGGVIITGSGNLTSGGLKSNWEAMAVEVLSIDDMAAAEKSWDAWLKIHSKELLDLDDPRVKAKAEANKRLRTKIKKAMKAPEDETPEVEAEIEAAQESVEEIKQELKLNPMLIAEIPKASDRWEQANFDKKSFIEFFGVTLGEPKTVRFFHVQNDGSLVAEKVRPPVAVKSRNFRFELAAASGLDYPTKGVPIGVFERVSDSDFHYILLMPGEKEHTLIAKYLDAYHPKKTRVLRRVPIKSGDMQKIWPDAPFFL